MNYKLLVLDVDGTLVDIYNKPVQYISPEVINAVRKANKKLYVSISSGRGMDGVDKVIKVLELQNNYNIIESGAKVIYAGKPEFVKSIDFESVRIIVNTGIKVAYNFGFYEDSIWKRSLSDYTGKPITSIGLSTKNNQETTNLILLLKPFLGSTNILESTNLHIPEGRTIMITNKDTSKENALQYIQKKLNISKGETISVGDMPNDLPLFKASGLKCSMGNADKRLKDEADYIAPSVTDNGVEEIINRFILNAY